MEKFSLFFRNLQQELKLFLFFTILFTLFRIVFISIYSYQLEDGSYREVILCLWYGLRLSLKTTGIIVLISAVFATLPQLLFTKWPSDLLRKVISSLSVVLFTVLFFLLQNFDLSIHTYNQSLLHFALTALRHEYLIEYSKNLLTLMILN